MEKIDFGSFFDSFPKIQKKHKSLLSQNRYLVARWLPSSASEDYFYIPLDAKNIKALAIDDSGKWIKISYNPGIGKSMQGWIEKKYLKKQNRFNKKFEEYKRIKKDALIKLFSFKHIKEKHKPILESIESLIKNSFSYNNRFSYEKIVYKCKKENKGVYKCFIDTSYKGVSYEFDGDSFEGGESGAIILFRFEKKNNKVKIKEILGSNIAG